MRKNVGTDNPVMTKILHMPDGQLRFTKCLHDFKKQVKCPVVDSIRVEV